MRSWKFGFLSGILGRWRWQKLSPKTLHALLLIYSPFSSREKNLLMEIVPLLQAGICWIKKSSTELDVSAIQSHKLLSYSHAHTYTHTKTFAYIHAQYIKNTSIQWQQPKKKRNGGKKFSCPAWMQSVVMCELPWSWRAPRETPNQHILYHVINSLSRRNL